MFKNIANLVKFRNHLLDRKKEKAKKGEPIEGQADYFSASLEPETRATKNFVLHRGRKQLSSLTKRLRGVKSFTLKQKRGDQDKAVEVEKPKFVIDYHDQRWLRQYDDSGDEEQSDEDEDEDAYVSAEESFDDCVDEERDRHGQGEPSARAEGILGLGTSEERNDEKFVLLEELSEIPTFLHTQACDKQLIEETRRLLHQRYAQNPDSLYEEDYKRMLTDDWTVSRFLLRRRLNPSRTVQLMESCGKFRKQYLMGRAEPWEFPAEFHLCGGLFQYAPDRVGNTTLYMRVKIYRRIAELNDTFKRFVLCNLEQCDTSTGGRGTAIVFDLTNCGLQSVDLAFLFWLLNSFRNYCPKGVSYILVLNLPWFLSATAKLAMSWMSVTNRRALRFVQGKEVEDFIAPENLPDYLGGSCKMDYCRVPEGSVPALIRRDGRSFDFSEAQANRTREHFKPWLAANYEQELLDKLRVDTYGDGLNNNNYK